jgi:hypothetical protein
VFFHRIQDSPFSVDENSKRSVMLQLAIHNPYTQHRSVGSIPPLFCRDKEERGEKKNERLVQKKCRPRGDIEIVA